MHFLRDVIMPYAFRQAWEASSIEQRTKFLTKALKEVSKKQKIDKELIKRWAADPFLGEL